MEGSAVGADDEGCEGSESDHTKPPITEMQVLVFDQPSNHADHDDYYKWIRADDIPGSDVSVVSYNWRKEDWYYEMNPCPHW